MPPRALVVTDSDSYVKWGAALAGQVPKDWSVRLVVLRGNAEPSTRQLTEALTGSRFTPSDAELVDRTGLVSILTSWRPDVVVAAARGMAVEVLGHLLAGLGLRPVVVTGLAGISIPVQRPGLRFRRCADVFIVHSWRELREFAEVDAQHRLELATLPFLEPDGVSRDSPSRDRIVFAAQAMVPASRTDRRRLLERLVETARAHPDRTVVVKVRALDGEPQTHVEQFPYDRLLAELVDEGLDAPANLVVEGGAMAWHLDRAVGLATISSTALLEAVARGVPCLAITDFGVGDRQINTVLVGSGLLGSSASLVSGAFRQPDPEWLEDNYLHDPADSTWVSAVEELLEVRARRDLPRLPPVPRGPAARARRALYERLSFEAPADRTSGLQRAFLWAGFWEHRRRWAVTSEGRQETAGAAPTSGNRS